MLPKKPTPGESTLKSRSIVAAKSLALIGVPSEYFRPVFRTRAVRLAVGRDLRQILREVRHDRRAVGAVRVVVPDERQVDVPHDPPALDGVRETRVEVVDACVVGDAEVGECLAAAVVVPVAVVPPEPDAALLLLLPQADAMSARPTAREAAVSQPLPRVPTVQRRYLPGFRFLSRPRRRNGETFRVCCILTDVRDGAAS